MQVWKHDRTISHCVCRYHHMHFSRNWPQLPIITSLGQDNVKAIKNQKRKPDWVWPSVPHLNKSLQRKKKKKKTLWTASFPFFSGLLLQQLITQSDSDSSHATRLWTLFDLRGLAPTADSKHPVLWGHWHFVSFHKKSEGQVVSEPALSSLTLPEICTEKMPNALCIVGSVFGESRPTCVWQRP